MGKGEGLVVQGDGHPAPPEAALKLEERKRAALLRGLAQMEVTYANRPGVEEKPES